MKTLDYMLDPTMRELYLPGVVAGLAIAAMGSVLSVLVVLKRLAFIGQGVSHAAFGGVGLAAALGLVGAAAAATVGQFALVAVFCLGAALLMGVIEHRGRTEADAAIGIVLVACMALGAILLRHAGSRVQWESFLFGDMLAVGWLDAWAACAVATGVLVTLWAVRRPLVFWAFDPVVAGAMGVRGPLLNLVLLSMLAIATVAAMKLAGVVLATAMLVLPGAAALRASTRSGRVLAGSLAAALAGVVGGLTLSFEMNWPPGPSIVCVLAALFGACAGVARARGR